MHDTYPLLDLHVNHFCAATDASITTGVCIEDVMKFITRSREYVDMSTSGSIYFSCDAVFPTASTCTASLTLPTQYSGDYKTFKGKCTLAFENNTGFGLF